MKNFNPPPIESLSQEVQDKLNSVPPINVFKRLAVLQRAFIPLMDTFHTFYTEESIAPRLREVAILRAGTRANSTYEVHQHVLIAKAVGITEQEINIILNEKEVTQLSELENVTCKVADEFCSNFSLTEATKDKLYSLMSTEAAMELILCISLYIGLACFIQGANVEIEADNPLEGRKTPL